MAKTTNKTHSPASFAKRIDHTPVHDEMRDSFMPYALSVTTARAIPDVRDGLKPVQRRILFAMNALGLRPGEPYRKSAAVVGEVMGKYHPHGDSAIYEAMVRLGQPFTMSRTLVDPKGNFGSLDDPPAAYRYTEARLTLGAMALVSGIDEDTVDFAPNFDGERVEPTCLPAALPNLLVNGANGIAVGMATAMAPHNLVEVAAAIKVVLTKRRPKPTVDDLMKQLRAPDFPNGGLIVADDGLRKAYDTGKGTVRVRARAEIEHVTSKRDRIIVTELPYMVGPERVLTKVRELIQSRKLTGISAVTDLTDRRNGLRLVVECRPGVGGRGVLADLYRLTPLEDNFNINNVALVNGVPTLLNLYELCKHYIGHRLKVIVRRTQFRLGRAKARAHIVEGLLIALGRIDEVIAIIRESANVAEARLALMSELGTTEIQTDHILELQLRRLTALEVGQLETELTELRAAIGGYEKLLKSEQRQRTALGKELAELVKDFGTPRRSSLISEADVAAFDELARADKANQEGGTEAFGTVSGRASGTAGAGGAGYKLVNGSGDKFDTGSGDKFDTGSGDKFDTGIVVITLSASGLLGRHGQDNPLSAKPGRHDMLTASLETSSQNEVFAVTDRGRLLSVAAQSIPEMARGSRGASVTEMFSLNRGEQVVGLFEPADAQLNAAAQLNADAQLDAAGEPTSLALVTRRGKIKRIERAVLRRHRNAVSLIKLAGDDSVVAAFGTPDGADLVMIASDGQVLRTAVDGVPTRGPAAGGVVGMRLKPGAELVAAGLVAFGTAVVLVTDAGAVKATDLSEIRSLGRSTGGTRALRLRGTDAPQPETCVSAAWIGRVGQVAVVVAEEGSSGRPDSLPVRVKIETTPPNETAHEVADERSGAPATAAVLSLLAVGEYRFAWPI